MMISSEFHTGTKPDKVIYHSLTVLKDDFSYNAWMKWISQLEKNKSVIVGCILLITICSLIVTSLRSPVAFDPFWHLQMGKDWLENGLSPWVDHHSFTYNGHKIINPPVIFQALLYLSTSQFGVETGFEIIRFCFFFLAIGTAILFLRQIKAPAYIYALVVPMLVFLLQLRSIVRPELLSYTFSIVALMLYFRAKNKVSTQNFLPIVALMWIWTLYHSSVIGYVIFFGLFLDCAVKLFNSKSPSAEWMQWLFWGLLILVVGFLNPSFSHPFEVINSPPEWKSIIQEYLPTTVPMIKAAPGFWAVVLFSLLTPVLAFRQRRFGLLVVWIVLVYSAISMRRMVTPSGIVVVLITAQLLVDDNLFRQLGVFNRKVWKNITVLGLLLLISATLFSNVERARYFMKEKQRLLGRYPIAVANYMKEKQISGRIFNDHGAGGYLIYKLSPQNLVYIDGRTTILYPLEHMQKYREVTSTTDPDVLREELDKYKVDQILWKHTQMRHDLVQEMGDFGLDFLDARFVLYTRGKSNFPTFGFLMARPECWRPDMISELIIERNTMDEILPAHSGLFPFADLVIGYSNAEDGKSFFDESIDGDEWFDEMRRFAGYRFLETENYDLAVNLFGGVEIRKPLDFLASAWAKIQVGDDETASQILEEFANLDWPRLRSEDNFILYKLYQLIESRRTLTEPEQVHVDVLKFTLVDSAQANLAPEHKLDEGWFCKAYKNKPIPGRR
ncbi:hypothetical protein ACFL1J_01260 [Pseudomonadota bacterium]